jgi:hypothetical protein
MVSVLDVVGSGSIADTDYSPDEPVAARCFEFGTVG